MRCIKNGATFLIGSDGACDLCLSWEGIRPQHCRLLNRAGRLTIEDLSSTTAVNGHRLYGSYVVVEQDATLRLGKVDLPLRLQGDDWLISTPGLDGGRS